MRIRVGVGRRLATKEADMTARDSEGYWQSTRARFNRRRFIATASVTAAAAGLVACSSSNNNNSGAKSAPVQPTAGQAAASATGASRAATPATGAGTRPAGSASPAALDSTKGKPGG